MPTRVAVITNVIPDYRIPFYSRLAAALGDALTIYCQAQIPGTGLKTRLSALDEGLRRRVELVPASCARSEKIGWQWLPLHRLLRDHDVYVFLGNPRVVSTVLLATLLRLLGRRVVIWGQQHSFSARGHGERIRLTWWRLFRWILVYTDHEARQLRAAGFTQYVAGLNNGLDQQRIERIQARWNSAALATWQAAHEVAGKCLLLSCSRVERSKDFALLVEMLPELIAREPDLLWIVIGDGSDRAALQQRADALGVAAHIRWIGELHDEEQLAPWFLSAQMLVHPGAIGLGLLHAYGYGLPVVTHSDAARHGPEFSALHEANRAFLFERGNADDLKTHILRLLHAGEQRDALAVDVHAVTQHYNVDVMVERFLAAVAAAADNRRHNVTAAVGETAAS